MKCSIPLRPDEQTGPEEVDLKGYNLPESTGPNDPGAPWNQAADQPEPLDDTTKIDVLLTALRDAKVAIMRCYPKKAVLILEEAEREVLRD